MPTPEIAEVFAQVSATRSRLVGITNNCRSLDSAPRAMADIDKAEKIQKIKQIVVIGLLFAARVGLVIRAPGPGITNFMVFLGIAIGIAKILFRIDNSTRTILRAIGNRR